MDLSRLVLVEPAEQWNHAYREFAEDLAQAGDERWIRPYTELGWEGFLAKNLRDARGENLAEGIVPQSVYWLVDEGGVIHGELRIRHRLTERLRLEGGHIGYTVRPSSRRRGVGKRMLALGLLEARQLGIDRALITCDESNLGSIGVIEGNGGREFETGPSPHSGGNVRRYWLTA